MIKKIHSIATSQWSILWPGGCCSVPRVWVWTVVQWKHRDSYCYRFSYLAYQKKDFKNKRIKKISGVDKEIQAQRARQKQNLDGLKKKKWQKKSENQYDKRMAPEWSDIVICFFYVYCRIYRRVWNVNVNRSESVNKTTTATSGNSWLQTKPQASACCQGDFTKTLIFIFWESISTFSPLKLLRNLFTTLAHLPFFFFLHYMAKGMWTPVHYTFENLSAGIHSHCLKFMEHCPIKPLHAVVKYSLLALDNVLRQFNTNCGFGSVCQTNQWRLQRVIG